MNNPGGPESRDHLLEALVKAEASLAMMQALLNLARVKLLSETSSHAVLPPLIDLVTTFDIKPTDLIDASPDNLVMLEKIYGVKGVELLQKMAEAESNGPLTPELIKQITEEVLPNS